jgi:hypothetical protein
MEVGEPVSPPSMADNVNDCPFEHVLDEPPKVDNDLEGVGGTLASRMKARKGTHKYEPLVAPNQPDQAVKNPRDDPNHELARGKKPVKIKVDTPNGPKTHEYPVTCAAHHCVPAQESLKGHDILSFMCKKGTSAAHNHSYSQGEVWSDLGYDVNGAQNGVFLPGNYAVGGGRGGTGQWVEDTADKEHEVIDEAPADNSDLLTGAHGDVSLTNKKWHYVRQAIRLAKAQFHDRHVDYSTKVVAGALTAIHEKHIKKFERAILGEECGECKKRFDKMEKHGVPTPYTMVDKLNGLSARLRGYLSAAIWPENIYTSGWMRNYMVAKQAKNPAADLAGG